MLALVATLTWAAWEWGGVGQTTKTSSPALVQKMDKILDKIGEPKNGTIAEVDKTILGVKSLVVHTDLVARHEEQQLTTWDDRGTVLFSNVNGAISGARSTIRQSTLTLQEATRAIAQVETVPEHLNPVLDNTAELANSVNEFASDKKTAELRDALTAELVSLHSFTDKATVLEGDVHSYIKPYDGNHPRRHEAWEFTKGSLGLGSQVGEALYYWKGVK